MLKIMNQIAAALAAPPNKGAKVGPSTTASSLPNGSGPSTPSHTIGRMIK